LRRRRVLPLLRARRRISSTPRERTTLSEEGRRNVGVSELPSAPLTAVIAATAPARGPGSGHSQRMGVQGMRGAASHLRNGARNREARLARADEHPSSLRARASPRRVKRDLGQALAAPQRGAAAVSGRYQTDYGGMLLSSAAHEEIRIVQPARLHNGRTRYPLSRRGFLAAQRCVHLLCSTLRAGHRHLHQRHISIGVLRDRERAGLSVLGFAPLLPARTAWRRRDPPGAWPYDAASQGAERGAEAEHLQSNGHEVLLPCYPHTVAVPFLPGPCGPIVGSHVLPSQSQPLQSQPQKQIHKLWSRRRPKKNVLSSGWPWVCG